MELPSCPSCHQSVLDDDAELCPFCGAPLKKMPAQKAPAQKAPGQKAPAQKGPAPASANPPKRTSALPARPAATGRPNSSQPAKASSAPDKSSSNKVGLPGDDALDDALRVDSSAGMDVPAASRQRSQLRPYKVVCPMCETVGYVPRSAAGKEIRCANRDCMVPIFTAPKPEKKKEEEAPSKRPSPMVMLGGLTLAVAASSFAVWHFVSNQAEVPVKNRNPDPPIPHVQVAAIPAKVDDADSKRQPPAAEKRLTVSEERDAALALMSVAAQDQNRNRSRALCERIAAQTAAETGDLKMAATFLDRLTHESGGLGFYRVPPLTSIAWRQLKRGEQAPALKTLDDALRSAADLPNVGRFSIDSAAWLSAALVAAGRQKEGRSLADRFPAAGPAGRLFAAEARAAAWNSYDVDQADVDRALLDVTSLELPVAVEIAVAMRFPAEALREARSISDPDLRSECEIVWLEAVARANSSNKGPPPKNADATSEAAVLAQLKPAAQARCHARRGLSRLRNQDKAQAETQLAAALTALGNPKVGAEFVMPSLENIYHLQPLDPAPARQTAIAWAEIARVQAGLGHADEANQNLAAALDWVRASAPSPAAVDAKQKAANGDANGLRKELGAALRIASDAKARDAVNEYRRNLRALEEVANARFALELEILDSSLAWADPAAVWKLIDKRIADGDPDRKEPFLTTPLPWQLILRSRSQGEQADAPVVAAIEKAVGGTQPPPAALFAAAIAQSKESPAIEAAKTLESVTAAEGAEPIERSERERAGLIIADRLVRDGQFIKAFQFARSFEDPLLKEEAMQWGAALACRLGQARQVKELLQKSNSSFLPTELVTAWRGFLVGLLARERAEPASAAPPTHAGPTGEDAKRAEASKS